MWTDFKKSFCVEHFYASSSLTPHYLVKLLPHYTILRIWLNGCLLLCYGRNIKESLSPITSLHPAFILARFTLFYRNNHQRCPVKKCCYKTSQNSQENVCAVQDYHIFKQFRTIVCRKQDYLDIEIWGDNHVKLKENGWNVLTEVNLDIFSNWVTKNLLVLVTKELKSPFYWTH